ncbi:MAG: hypothetical protein LBJ71_03990 [Holosporaceae bacterium]|nr:hypothetical protein [Holosporaceae bacterium]
MSFEKTLMIGRQSCFIEYSKLNLMLRAYDPSYTLEEAQKIKEELDNTKLEWYSYSEPLFHYLGAKAVDSVDYCDYERATIIHDMNVPIHQSLKDSFSLVYDGGTLEHVFNYPVAIKNCMDMVKINGHLMLMTPANNAFGHGFYQFSPELFYSLLTEVNGYSDTVVFIQDKKLKWYKVISPQKAKERVDICIDTKGSAMLTVISKKIGNVPERLTAMQSDYVDLWEKGIVVDGTPSAQNGLLLLYRVLPKNLRIWLTPKIKKILNVFGREAYNKRARIRKFYERFPDFKNVRRGGGGKIRF